MQRALRQAGRRIKAAGYFLLGELSLLIFNGLRLTDPAWASDKSAKLLRFVGPKMREHRIGRANLQAAFPDWTPEKIEQVLAGVWDNLGRVGAEFVHLDRLWH